MPNARLLSVWGGRWKDDKFIVRVRFQCECGCETDAAARLPSDLLLHRDWPKTWQCGGCEEEVEL